MPGGVLLFPTPFGVGGLAWSAAGFVRAVLDAPDAAAAEAALRRGEAVGSRTGAPPPEVARVARALRGHLQGRLTRFDEVPLDLRAATPFARSVYRVLRRVPPGRTTTYGVLARAVGRPGAARAVGQVLARNPLPLLIPCHRVLPGSGQGLGGFTSWGGETTKARLLYLEGVPVEREAARAEAHLRAADPTLRRLMDRMGPVSPPLPPEEDPFRALVTIVLHQQLSMAAARTVRARLLAALSGEVTPERLLSLAPSAWRRAGVSRPKAATLRRLARAVASGALDLRALGRLPDGKVTKTLTRIPGIGVWSARMFLLFHLRRPDVLPVEDRSFREAVQQAYGLPRPPDAALLERLTAAWHPFRSLGAVYLWRSLERVSTR